MPENVVDAAISITDMRREGAARVLKALAEVDMPGRVRVRLLERLKANGAI